MCEPCAMMQAEYYLLQKNAGVKEVQATSKMDWRHVYCDCTPIAGASLAYLEILLKKHGVM